MNECKFSTFEHSPTFNFECSNVLHPRSNWLNSIFLTINYCLVTVLWLKTPDK